MLLRSRHRRPHREYQPSGALFARKSLLLRGVTIAAGDLIPAELLWKRKHKQLWSLGRADHTPKVKLVKPRDLAPGEMLVDAMRTEIDAPAFIGAASTLETELATVAIDAEVDSSEQVTAVLAQIEDVLAGPDDSVADGLREIADELAELEALTAPAPSVTPAAVSSAEPALPPVQARTSTQATSLDDAPKPAKPPRRGR